MKLVILDAATLGEGLDFQKLSQFGELTVFENTKPEEAAQRLLSADIAIVNKIKLGASNLQEAAQLKLICEFATGYDNIDLDFCRARGIGVCNVRGYSTHSVAQLTVLMALTLLEKLSAYTEAIRTSVYQQSGVANLLSPVYHELCGKTWGIVGAGAIGRQVAKIAEAFGCHVLAFTRTPTEALSCVPLNTLLSEADVISLHTPLNDGTRGLIGAPELAQMKRDAILINVARGAVTDEAAIASALLAGNLGGFASDVYSVEPFPKTHPFHEIRALPNVLLTPHMAWGALEARLRCLCEIVKNIEDFLSGGFRNRVDLSHCSNG